jgi:hypothetical protein
VGGVLQSLALGGLQVFLRQSSGFVVLAAFFCVEDRAQGAAD